MIDDSDPEMSSKFTRILTTVTMDCSKKVEGETRPVVFVMTQGYTDERGFILLFNNNVFAEGKN